MATADDIRAWGAENGWDVSGTKLPSGLRAAFDGQPSDVGDESGTEGERPPAIVKPSTVERLRGAAARVRTSTPKKAVGRRAKPRVSVDRLISNAWQFIGQIVNPINPAVARMLDVQAPVAGMVLEDVVANTIADKLMQPLARGMNGGEVAFALAGPPLIVAAITMRPDRAGILIPILKQSLRTWISVAGPHLDKLKEQDDKFEEEHGKSIDAMIEYILQPYMPDPGAVPSE